MLMVSRFGSTEIKDELDIFSTGCLLGNFVTCAGQYRQGCRTNVRAMGEAEQQRAFDLLENNHT